MQGSLSAEQLGRPEGKFQPGPATVAWDSFKSLAKPGDCFRLVGDNLPSSSRSPRAAEHALPAPAYTPLQNKNEQPVAEHADMRLDAALSSSQGLIMPAGSNMPLVTDAEVAKWAVALPSSDASSPVKHIPVASRHYSSSSHLPSDEEVLSPSHHQAAAGPAADHGGGDLAEADMGDGNSSSLGIVISQADRLMMLAQVRLQL